MDLKIKKRLASQMLKCSRKRVRFDQDRLNDIKEAITKSDIRSLIKDKAILKIKEKGISRVRARKKLLQKRKGKQKGPGSRKGKKTARLEGKIDWMNRVRAQRNLLKELRKKGVISKKNYRELYMNIKGGFFRSKRHINLYIKEHELAK